MTAREPPGSNRTYSGVSGPGVANSSATRGALEIRKIDLQARTRAFDPTGARAIEAVTEGLGSVRFSVHQTDRWPVLEVRVPAYQVVPVTMRGQAADGVDPCANPDRLVVNTHVVMTIYQAPTEGAAGLEADDDDLALGSPEEVPKLARRKTEPLRPLP